MSLPSRPSGERSPDHEPHGAPSSASQAADDLRRLLGAPEAADVPDDTPPGPPLPAPEGLTRGRAVWRCEHCGSEYQGWVRPQCTRCHTMSTQAVRWVAQ